MSGGEHGLPLRLDGLLARAALTEPERDAVVFDGRTLTWREVHERASRLAGALAELGVVKGDRVALWTTNRSEFVEIFFGVPQLGAIVSPLDYWWNWEEAQAALGQIQPRVLIVGTAQARIVASSAAAVREAGIEHVFCLDDSYQGLVAGAAPLGEPVSVTADDPALILFTSGSTGRSKGAVHTHGGLLAAATTMCLELGLRDGERTLHFLPLFSSCLEHLLPLTLVRGTHVLLSQFDARVVWETVRDAAITHFDAVPTTLRRILEAAPDRIPSSLRLISYASERMPTPLITALIERMPAVSFVQFYGMIEHLCLTVLGASEQLRKIGTVGHPMVGAELYLVDAENQLVENGATGEIVARSPTLFAGYWGDAAATAQVMHGQGMRTGDLGRFDDEGFLWLEGRVKEVIKTGGFTVIPTEVEGALMAHPQVTDAAVVGVPDQQWGEAVHAFVILAPQASVAETDLLTFCQERLARYKRPKVIHVVADLPRTGIGKIARRVVRERLIASANQPKESR
ncbi:MAG TPA: AMP-binding protein [Gemmatimonadales bacterium]|nr:AMP-binding protein [Gemmatimonadales bacterium]